MSDGAERPAEPRCPRCGETRMIEVMQKGWHFCSVCACPFRWPQEIRGEAEYVPAVPNRTQPNVSGAQPRRERNGKRIEFG